MQATKEPSTGQLTYNIKSVKVSEFSYTDPKGLLTPDKLPTFNVTVTDGFQYNEKLITTETTVKLVIPGNPETLICKMKFDMVFDIVNFDEIFSWETKKIPVDVVNHLNGFSLSFARGILYEKTVGTPLIGIILPVMDPSTLLPPTKGKNK